MARPTIAIQVEITLKQLNLNPQTWFTLDMAMKISFFLSKQKITLSQAIHKSANCAEIIITKLSNDLKPLFNLYKFSSYDSPDLPVTEIYQIQSQQPRAQILDNLHILTPETLLLTLDSFNCYLSIPDMEFAIAKFTDFRALKTDNLRLISSFYNRLFSIKLERKDPEIFDFLSRVLAPAQRLLLLKIQPPRVPFFASYKKQHASSYYAKHVEEQDLQPPERRDQFDKVKEIVKKNKSTEINAFDYVGLASLSELQVMLRQEPFRHIDSKNMVVNVSRERILIDYISFIIAVAGSLEHAGTAARQDFRVKFEGEKGADGGGLKNEFIYIGIQEIFKRDFCMFKTYDNQAVWIDNFSVLQEEDLKRQFTYFGLFLGVALLNGICIGDRLPPFFYKLLLKEQTVLYDKVDIRTLNDLFKVEYSDLLALDEELLTNLLNLQTLRNQGTDISDLCLNFSVTSDVFDWQVTKDLTDNGAKTSVTNENLDEYIHQRIYFEILQQQAIINYIRIGFTQVIPIFKQTNLLPFQLEQILGGKSATDLTQLQQITKYSEPFNKNHSTIKMFWVLIHSLPQKDKENFLLFVFSTHRVPINGFCRFTIECSGDSLTGYPTAHTCGNVLCLPAYKDENVLREKLTFALENYLGFGIV
ncbi:Ubiquitin-protein ligase [Spironucleus salmonicida]|uniref:HECT-type E3 ubiquitin transferase n=1 Tax=Spironucleus salmonicida TaxID=348837 RepID=V6LNF0_9EUKA|nr:Ubiquitin-protein ligase [Spironucleus salmonicida]|eukprot:EST46187.1 Ubiquitin-protein ligase [Spironucleus salmonicida]